jgi:sorbitol/mannitol transport system permease protein
MLMPYSTASTAPASDTHQPTRVARKRHNVWKLRAPLLPALLVVIAVTQAPFFITAFYSLFRWNLVSTSKRRFVGIRNYVDAISDPVFLKAIANTAFMTVSIVVMALVVGTLLALGLQRSFRGRTVARTLAITPFFVMPVAAALFWKAGLFDPTFGLLGWSTSALGLGRVNWVSEYPRLSIIILTAWQWSSFALLILLAGMQSFPVEVTEAASIDGAGRWMTFRRLMLPHLRPFFELTGLLASMYVLENFAAIATLTSGGPAYATTNLSYYVYLEAFSAFDLGQASAYGVITLAIAIALVMPMLKVVAGIFKTGGRA